MTGNSSCSSDLTWETAVNLWQDPVCRKQYKWISIVLGVLALGIPTNYLLDPESSITFFLGVLFGSIFFLCCLVVPLIHLIMGTWRKEYKFWLSDSEIRIQWIKNRNVAVGIKGVLVFLFLSTSILFLVNPKLVLLPNLISLILITIRYFSADPSPMVRSFSIEGLTTVRRYPEFHALRLKGAQIPLSIYVYGYSVAHVQEVLAFLQRIHPDLKIE